MSEQKQRFFPDFPVGANVTNQEIMDNFGCANTGGIRYVSINKTIVLISDQTKKNPKWINPYGDRWKGDIFYYTGMGKEGDQSLYYRGNKRILNSNREGTEIHLFEVSTPNQLGRFYVGAMKLCGEPFQEKQPDSNGNIRKVWMFPLKRIK